MENKFIKIPLTEVRENKLPISAEAKVFFYIRGLEENSGFVAGENLADPIGICIMKTKTLAFDLGLTETQVRDALHHLQYRYGLGARIWVDVYLKGFHKYWCSIETIERLNKAGLICSCDEEKVRKLMSGKI